MLQKISIAIIVLFAITLLALNASADIKRDKNFFQKQSRITKNTLTKQMVKWFLANYDL